MIARRESAADDQTSRVPQLDDGRTGTCGDMERTGVLRRPSLCLIGLGSFF